MPVGQDRVSAAGPDRLTGSFAETGWKEDRMNATTYRLAALAATCLIASAPAHAQQAPPDDDQPTGARVDHDTVSKANESDIAKESQNPVGNLTILPLELLKKLDDLGIADDTIIMYSTDNGPENDTWPDGANTPFRAQKDTNWEGAWRVPAFLRWPGKIKAGSVFNGIGSHFDMFPTLLAAAGDPDVTQKLLNGCTV